MPPWLLVVHHFLRGGRIALMDSAECPPLLEMNHRHDTKDEESKRCELDRFHQVRHESDIHTQRSVPWVEKFRPVTIGEMNCACPASMSRLCSIVTGTVTAPPLLLYGPPGTGKTTAATVVSLKAIVTDRKESGLTEGEVYRNTRLFMVVNGSDERRTEDLRKIARFVNLSVEEEDRVPGLRVLLVDEAEGMTRSSQLLLKDIIDKAVRTNVLVILCANDRSKVVEGLQSSCVAIEFLSVEPSVCSNVIVRAVERTNEEYLELGQPTASFDEDALHTIVMNARGDMRRCLNDANMVHTSCVTRGVSTITENHVMELIEAVPLQKLHRILFGSSDFRRGSWDGIQAGRRLVAFLDEGHMAMDVVGWLVAYTRIVDDLDPRVGEPHKRALTRCVLTLQHRVEQGVGTRLQFQGFSSKLANAFLALR